MPFIVIPRIIIGPAARIVRHLQFICMHAKACLVRLKIHLVCRKKMLVMV